MKRGNPRKLKKRRRRGAISPGHRRVLERLAERDGAKCWLCGGPINMQLAGGTRPERSTVEHRIPKSRGGTNDPKNLKLSHAACNSKRGNRLGKGPAANWKPLTHSGGTDPGKPAVQP